MDKPEKRKYAPRTLETIYLVTMWSGGRASRRWKTKERPRMLPQGTGVVFRSLTTKLSVWAVGNISVEEFEQGREYPGFDEELDDDAPETPPGSQELII